MPTRHCKRQLVMFKCSKNKIYFFNVNIFTFTFSDFGALKNVCIVYVTLPFFKRKTAEQFIRKRHNKILIDQVFGMNTMMAAYPQDKKLSYH